MAIYSMTGFGEGSASGSGIRVNVELSSVNRKQLDINVALPRGLIILDALIQRQVRAVFSRGRVSGVVRVEFDGEGKGAVRVDENLAKAYVREMRRVATSLRLEDNLSADLLLRIPGFVLQEQDHLSGEAVGEVLEKALAKALKGLCSMRQAEGRALVKDIRERLSILESEMEAIERLSTGVVGVYRDRLMERLGAMGVEGLCSDERIVKEVALFADRCDISEELTRLKSHLAQARDLLKSKEPIGRTLDFLCQELFREINTTGSKANEVEITRHVLQFKTELERIREQVQNIE
jgi:uncharacterized protein (TIGR00255 family)